MTGEFLSYSREDVELVLSDLLPFVELMNRRHVEYCLVGGTAVMLQLFVNDAVAFRPTLDFDFILPGNYSERHLVEDYCDAYGTEDTRKSLRDYIVRGLEGYSTGENVEIVGAKESVQGFYSPSMDLCLMLNGLDSTAIQSETLRINGVDVRVATVPQLIAMKEKTIQLLKTSVLDSSRPQDFADLAALRQIQRKRESREKEREAGKLPKLFEKLKRGKGRA